VYSILKMFENVYTEPLPVGNLLGAIDDRGLVTLTWEPNTTSYQENFKISYHEVETQNFDSSSVVTDKSKYALKTLFPGRNYSITVQAVSGDMESTETTIYQATS